MTARVQAPGTTDEQLQLKTPPKYRVDQPVLQPYKPPCAQIPASWIALHRDQCTGRETLDYHWFPVPLQSIQ